MLYVQYNATDRPGAQTDTASQSLDKTKTDGFRETRRIQEPQTTKP